MALTARALCSCNRLIMPWISAVEAAERLARLRTRRPPPRSRDPAPGAGSLDGGVECQQVGLLRDAADGLQNAADGVGLGRQRLYHPGDLCNLVGETDDAVARLGDHAGTRIRLLIGLSRHFCGEGSVAGDPVTVAPIWWMAVATCTVRSRWAVQFCWVSWALAATSSAVAAS